MPFQNTDLMLKVLPRLGIDAAQVAKICILHTWICRWPTFCAITCPRIVSLCGRCSILVTIDGGGCRFNNSCGAGGSACDPTDFCIGSDPFVITDIEDLVTIRAELTATLKQLDQVEKELGASARRK